MLEKRLYLPWQYLSSVKRYPACAFTTYLPVPALQVDSATTLDTSFQPETCELSKTVSVDSVAEPFRSYHEVFKLPAILLPCWHLLVSQNQYDILPSRGQDRQQSSNFIAHRSHSGIEKADHKSIVRCCSPCRHLRSSHTESPG